MSMTVTQLILIVLALIAMFWGLITLYQSTQSKKKRAVPTVLLEDDTDAPALAGEIASDNDDINAINTDSTHGKDGLPILPRHQRPPVDDTFAAEITESNPDGTVKLSAKNTELQLPTENQIVETGDQTAENNNDKLVKTLKTDSADTVTRTSENDDAFSVLANATETITPALQTFDENQLKKEGFSETSPILDTHIQAQINQEQNSPLNNAVQNINISIFPDQQFSRIAGRDLLALVDKYGMKYGAMSMFHRYESKDGTGLLWFSMMMITEEGIMPFDLNKLPTQHIKGLVLFLSLPHPKAVQGFDSMISVAGLLAHDLQASVYDETGEPLNKENTQLMRDVAVNFGKA